MVQLCEAHTSPLHHAWQLHNESSTRRGAHLEAVSEEVGVGGAPGERPELHDRDEARKVVDLALQVLAVPHAAQVEQLCACAQPIPLFTFLSSIH